MHSNQSDRCSGSIGGLKAELRRTAGAQAPGRKKEVEEFCQTFYILVIFRSSFFSFSFSRTQVTLIGLYPVQKNKQIILCIPPEDSVLSPPHTALSNIKRRKAPSHGRRCFVAPFAFREGGRKQAAARSLRVEGTTPCEARHQHLHHSDWWESPL